MMENTNRLPLQVIDARSFSWSGREGVAFASDLPNLRPSQTRRSQIYKDACDWGLEIRNPRTGKGYIFAHIGDERNREGELIAELFRAVGRPEITVKIFND